MLSNRQASFVAEYGVDRNATQAAIRAGYSRRGADVQGVRLLKRPEVARAVQRAIAEQSARTGITADWVVLRLYQIACADPNELIQHRRVACGTCHGGDGTGGNSVRKPDPECPQCLGEGRGTIFIGDTTKLSPDAAALYAGVKTTKDCIEIKMHDQMAALEKLGRHLGLFDPKNTVGSADSPFRMLIDRVQGHAFPIVQNPPSFDDEED